MGSDTWKHFLLKYDDNWADEMDIDGLFVMNREQRDEFIAAVEVFKLEERETEMCVGTNEDVTISGKKGWGNIEDHYTIINISEEEYHMMNRLKITDVGFAKTFFEHVIYEVNHDEDEEEW